MSTCNKTLDSISALDYVECHLLELLAEKFITQNQLKVQSNLIISNLRSEKNIRLNFES